MVGSRFLFRDTNLDENDVPEMYFATDFEVLNQVEHFELKPGGSNIPVTEQNKHEYIMYVFLKHMST